jgi:hypothetical protein
MQMKVFSPIMKRDPRGKLFAESMVCVLLPMRLYQQTWIVSPSKLLRTLRHERPSA